MLVFSFLFLLYNKYLRLGTLRRKGYVVLEVQGDDASIDLALTLMESESLNR